MLTQNDFNKAANLLGRGQDYIINCDLDGLICGLLIEHYIGGRVVGFSRCNGYPNDALWYDNRVFQVAGIHSFSDAVFVDLPVVLQNMRMIDQHFIAVSNSDLAYLSADNDKINPNIVEGYSLSSGHYTSKFPFGSCHFILALLEHMGINVSLNLTMPPAYQHLQFQPSDLIYRADRCVGNAYNPKYARNCRNWADWLISFGGAYTSFLFSNLFTAPNILDNEGKVETYLQTTLGASKPDGDFTNMIAAGNWNGFDNMQRCIADILGLNPMNISYSSICCYTNLTGKREEISNTNTQTLNANRLFSQAITKMRKISVTLY